MKVALWTIKWNTATAVFQEVYDTVGQPLRTEIGVLNMPSLKAKKLRKPSQEKVLLAL
jgi:hypothetical protein